MEDHPTRPVLVLTNNLFLYPRIQQAVRPLGLPVEILNQADLVEAKLEGSRERLFTEPLTGPDGAFMRRIVDLQPCLILLDFESDEIPWKHWIRILKTSSATRRIPILAYGSHVDVEKQTIARDMGADRVISRAILHASLPKLIEKFVRLENPDSFRTACGQPMSGKAAHGLDLLNEGQYYQAHEVLERAWLEENSPRRHLYRALLQLSVAYHHAQTGNIPGARKLILRMQQWLRPLPMICCGVDIGKLHRIVQSLSAQLEAATLEDQQHPPAEWFQPVSGIGLDRT